MENTKPHRRGSRPPAPKPPDATPPPLPATGFVRKSYLLKYVFPVGPTTFHKNIKDGTWKLTPIHLGQRVTAYDVREVRELIDSLAGRAAA